MKENQCESAIENSLALTAPLIDCRYDGYLLEQVQPETLELLERNFSLSPFLAIDERRVLKAARLLGSSELLNMEHGLVKCMQLGAEPGLRRIVNVNTTKYGIEGFFEYVCHVGPTREIKIHKIQTMLEGQVLSLFHAKLRRLGLDELLQLFTTTFGGPLLVPAGFDAGRLLGIRPRSPEEHRWLMEEASEPVKELYQRLGQVQEIMYEGVPLGASISPHAAFGGKDLGVVDRLLLDLAFLLGANWRVIGNVLKGVAVDRCLFGKGAR